METENTTSQAATAPAIVLYDADAEQRIPFRRERDGESFDITFILGPQTDEALAEYNRLIAERYTAAEEDEAGDPNAMETTDSSFRAAVWLLNDRLLDVEGFGDEGEEKPEDWRQLVFDDDRDRAAVINDAYLAAQPVPAPLAPKGKRLPWRRQPGRTVIHLLAVFSGYELRLTHERTVTPTAQHIEEFNSIRKSRYLVQGTRLGKGEIRVPPKARRLAALYDALGYQTTGYKGRVPLHHKGLVVSFDLGREDKAVRKNGTGSSAP